LILVFLFFEIKFRNYISITPLAQLPWSRHGADLSLTAKSQIAYIRLMPSKCLTSGMLKQSPRLSGYVIPKEVIIDPQSVTLDALQMMLDCLFADVAVGLLTGHRLMDEISRITPVRT